MDTNAVVLAFDRFIAYRGCPTDFLSDNWKTPKIRNSSIGFVTSVCLILYKRRMPESTGTSHPLMDLTMEGSTRP